MAGRRCTVCDHPERETIDHALAGQRAAFRTIADRCGLSHQSLLRHGSKCVPESLARTAEAERLAQSNRLADEIARLRRVMEETAEEARADGKWGQAIAGFSASLNGLKLLSESVIELERMRREDRREVPITEHPEFRSYFNRVLKPLEKYPEILAEIAALAEEDEP